MIRKIKLIEKCFATLDEIKSKEVEIEKNDNEILSEYIERLSQNVDLFDTIMKEEENDLVNKLLNSIKITYKSIVEKELKVANQDLFINLYTSNEDGKNRNDKRMKKIIEILYNCNKNNNIGFRQAILRSKIEEYESNSEKLDRGNFKRLCIDPLINARVIREIEQENKHSTYVLDDDFRKKIDGYNTGEIKSKEKSILKPKEVDYSTLKTVGT